MKNSNAHKAIASFLLNTKAKTTKQKEKTKLKCFCRFLFDNDEILSADWGKIDQNSVIRFIEHKLETTLFTTTNNYLSVIKLFAKECFYHNAIDSNTYNSIRDISKYRGTPPDNGRALKLREINKIKNYFSGNLSAREIRNYAIFTLAVSCGLRRAEISAINIENIKGRKLTVIGKGNKARDTYLTKTVLNALSAWRNQLPVKKGALFVHVTRSDKIQADRLGVKGVHYVIQKIQRDCKINQFTTHDLRRTFATTLLQFNNDIFTVQDLLGHSSPTTTKRYDKRGEQGKIKAVNSLPF